MRRSEVVNGGRPQFKAPTSVPLNSRFTAMESLRHDGGRFHLVSYHERRSGVFRRRRCSKLAPMPCLAHWVLGVICRRSRIVEVTTRRCSATTQTAQAFWVNPASTEEFTTLSQKIYRHHMTQVMRLR
jgi:hypothetical protein